LELFAFSFPAQINGMTECCRRIHVPQVSMPEAVQIAYQLGPGCVHCFASAAGFLTSCVLVRGLPKPEEREMIKPPSDWMMFFGIAAFSLTAVGSVRTNP